MINRGIAKLKGALTEGWYVKGDEQARSRKYMLFFSYSNNIIVNLIGANFFTGLLLLMEADDGFIGAMSMIATGANMLQLFSPLLIERFAKRKRLIIAGHAVIQFFNVLFIGLIPIFPVETQIKLSLVTMSVFIVNILSAFLSPGMTVWHLQSLPVFIRGPFFSLIAMTVGPLVSIMALLGSRFVDIFKDIGYEYGGLMALRGVSLLLAAFNIYVLIKIKEYPYTQNDERFGFKDLLVKPFKEPRYLMTVAVAFIWSFCANLPGPYYTVYLLKNVNVSYSFIMMVTFISVPMSLFLTPVWTLISRRISWYKMVAIGMLTHTLYYTLLTFVTKTTLFLFPLGAFIVYAASAGINLAFNNMPYVNIPEKNQTAFIGFYSTMANMGALLGVTLSRYSISVTDAHILNFLGVQLINKQYIMLIAGIFMAVGAVVIVLIQKRQDNLKG